jgi:hypothetical protein
MDFTFSTIGRNGESIDTYCFPRFQCPMPDGQGWWEGRHGECRHGVFRSIIDLDRPFFFSSLKAFVDWGSSSGCGMLCYTIQALGMSLRTAIPGLLLLLF